MLCNISKNDLVKNPTLRSRIIFNNKNQNCFKYSFYKVKHMKIGIRVIHLLESTRCFCLFVNALKSFCVSMEREKEFLRISY